ncbi:MAG: MFS transporter [Pseudonocardiaceae bacterium]
MTSPNTPKIKIVRKLPARRGDYQGRRGRADRRPRDDRATHLRLGVEVEFVVAAYVLVYGVLLITGGRLGDLYGQKRLFLTGLAIFTVASALCGVAPSLALLIAARALQGLGGALMYPQVLAIIRITFSGAELNRALSIFGSGR